MNKYLLSDDTRVMATALKKAIESDRGSTAKQLAREGRDYYNYKHDILKNRIFYMNNEDILVEDKFASNIRIPHTFFTELVDQKVQYLLSQPVELKVEDDKLGEYLKEYYDDDMQMFLQEIVEGFSQKGIEYAYARTNANDRLCFQVSDSIKTFDIYDDMNAIKRIGRYYTKDIYRDGKNEVVTFAEIWTDELVYCFNSDKQGNFHIDSDKENNPRKHVIAKTEEGETLARSYGTLPFFKVANNRNERTDLEPIKAIIDDYDLMAGFLSNNLQDFSEAIYVVKGFKGDNLDKLRQNIKAKKTVGVGDNGGMEVKTVEIPVEARKTKLEIDRQAIYKFGMGFDSSQIGSTGGQITNVAIQSGYSLLNMKCNKAEIRLRTLIAWMNEMVIEDINRRYSKTYTVADIKDINMERETMTDKKENAEISKIEAETESVAVQTLLMVAPRIDDDSVLEMICEMYELDFKEVKKLIDEQDYQSGLQGEIVDEDEDDEQENPRA